MSYSNISIRQLISGIKDKEYYLPAIQRKFVWDEDKICNLFDSIMRDYPIGTFLFWNLNPETARKYTFYEFLTTYHERDSKNSLVEYDFERPIKGVLDGQQRISSMFIALQGTYATRKKYAKRAKDDSYPQREFYLNLCGEINEYDFKFLEKNELFESEEKFYFRVRDILLRNKNDDRDDIIDELTNANPKYLKLLESNRKNAGKKVGRLLEKINDTRLINFYSIIDKDLDDILDIFIRVNGAGTVLSKSDLLFSTLVAHWEDGREQIEKLIDEMNGEDKCFDFNTDFLMRTCLFLVDAPMSFKVQSFNPSTIKSIKGNWEAISVALKETATILREFGYNSIRLSSNYAATPIAYYLLKGGLINGDTKSELCDFVRNSLLKRVYSGQADTALSGLREGLRQKSGAEYHLREDSFSFEKFKTVRLSGGKKLTVDKEDIEDFLDTKKGPFAFLVLSALYPDLKLDQISFHQDHMHPQSKFNPNMLSELGLTGEQVEDWIDKCDQVPNLQLLKGSENSEKQATNLADWVQDRDDQVYYRKQNFIDSELSLEFLDFESFFKARRNKLKSELCKAFGVAQNESQ